MRVLPLSRPALPRLFPRASLLVLAAVALLDAQASGGQVKGRIDGQETLIPAVFVEAAKPDSHRFTWREPSPTVRAEFRALTANPSRDVCIAALATTTPPAARPYPRAHHGGPHAADDARRGAGGAPVVRESRPLPAQALHRREHDVEGRDDRLEPPPRVVRAARPGQVRDPRRALPERPLVHRRRAAGRRHRLPGARRRVRARIFRPATTPSRPTSTGTRSAGPSAWRPRTRRSSS